MRPTHLVAALFATLAGAAATAQETGAGVTVETVPGGRTAIFATPTEAQAACVAAGGNFELSEWRFVCVNPRRALESTQAEAAPAATPAGPDTTDSAARGIAVESITLNPGESATFVLAQGYSHQLLRRAEPSAPGAIMVRYAVSGGCRNSGDSRSLFVLEIEASRRYAEFISGSAR